MGLSLARACVSAMRLRARARVVWARGRVGRGVWIRAGDGDGRPEQAGG
jgi:hypothetical protein